MINLIPGQTATVRVTAQDNDGDTDVHTVTFTAESATACAILGQPSDVCGAVGAVAAFGGSASGTIQWQTSPAPTGPWVSATPPTVIPLGESYWRFYCLDDPTIISNVVSLTGEQILAQPFRVDADCDPLVCTPGSGGVERLVSSIGEFDAAAAIANPGDVIRLTQSVTGKLIWNQRSGAPGNHICITSNPGVVVNSAGFDVVTIQDVQHVDLINMNVDATNQSANNPGPYVVGIRNVQGTAGSPCLVHGNTLTNGRVANINLRNNTAYIDVLCNTITGPANVLVGLPWYVEGVYCGNGPGLGINDRVNNINVRRNRISGLTADAVELKPGSHDCQVTDNELFNIDLHSNNFETPTGAIAFWPVGSDPGNLPSPNCLIARNRIWNITQNPNFDGPTDWVQHVIAIHWGGVTVQSNVGWDNQNVALVHINSFDGTNFGPDPITVRCNTTDLSKQTINNADGVAITSGSNIPDDFALASFVGPTTGTADAGEGPGSGFQLVPGSGDNNGSNCVDVTGASTNPDSGAFAPGLSCP